MRIGAFDHEGETFLLHVHVVPDSSHHLVELVDFRDRLRADPALVAEYVAVKRAMLRAAARSILLNDHSKLGKTALHQLAPLSAFDLVVVDDGVDEGGLRALEEAKTPFAVAPR